MHYAYSRYLKPYSQKLRKELTKEERKLYYEFLKQLPFRVIRQKPIGKYIVDFYCPIKKIVIELDGSQHYDDEGKQKDEERNAYLSHIGITILRYTNVDINKNFYGVCLDIYSHLNDKAT